ncbi:MAG: tRNA pseudouridine(38-40) synthase TruA [Phycisphaerales bacterium]|nr:tRNA pseudouridine(38-40) synthase TruA [Phycisphaerales bacterium]
MERNIRLVIAYDGTDFHGWQRQPGLRTVQGEIEAVLMRIIRHPVNLAGSGRTDAGVHARGQVANFKTTSVVPPDRIRRALESRLPADIGIRTADDVHPDFIATSSAEAKMYRYRIYHAPTRPVEQMAHRYTYHCWIDLDIERMRSAAGHFVGAHDFSGFMNAGTVRESYVRRVLACTVTRQEQEIHIDVEGTGFLYNQVRIMVGTLFEIGRGRREPDALPEIIASRDRTRAGQTMPPQGLCLEWVRYPAHLLVPPEPSAPTDPPEPTA